MAILFCDICNRSIPPDEVRFAERRNDLVYCRACQVAPISSADSPEGRLLLRRWLTFLGINLLWFMAIIVITQVCGTSLEVISLSVIAFALYALSLVWLHHTLTK